MLFNSYSHPDKPLGDGVIPLKDMKDKFPALKTIKLTDPDTGKLSGEVHLEISYTDAQSANTTREDYIYEYQRWAGDWGDPTPIDPGKYSSKDGSQFKNAFSDVVEEVPRDWDVVQDWATTITLVCDN